MIEKYSKDWTTSSTHFKMINNLKQKKSLVHLHVLCAYKVVSRKIDLSCRICKKNGAKFFSFLHRPQKILVFRETWRARIYYEDVHVQFFLKNKNLTLGNILFS
jgi:hypothetical protein